MNDPVLMEWKRELVVGAARALDELRMIRFDEVTGMMAATDLGRTASHYYIRHDTVEVYAWTSSSFFYTLL